MFEARGPLRSLSMVLDKADGTHPGGGSGQPEGGRELLKTLRHWFCIVGIAARWQFFAAEGGANVILRLLRSSVIAHRTDGALRWTGIIERRYSQACFQRQWGQ